MPFVYGTMRTRSSRLEIALFTMLDRMAIDRQQAHTRAASACLHPHRHGEDMAGSGAKRAAWNQALLQEGLAPAYIRLLLEASGELGPCMGLYRSA
jgi:hypothetical protein